MDIRQFMKLKAFLIPEV